MRTPRRRAAALGLLLAVMPAGCEAVGDGLADPTGTPTRPTPTPAPSPSPSPDAGPASPSPPGASPTPQARFDVPDDIDPVYAQAVLDALDEALTPGIQASADQDGLAPELEDRMEALWTEEWMTRTQPLFEEEFEESADRIADEVDTRYHDVQELVVADEDCIIVRSTVDFSAWLDDDAETPPPGRYVTALVPRGEDPSADGINPTPWLVNYDQESDSEIEPDELCGDEAADQ